MQSAAVRVLTQSEQSQHVALTLREWHWLIFRDAIAFKIALPTYITGEQIGETVFVSPSKPRHHMRGLHCHQKNRLES